MSSVKQNSIIMSNDSRAYKVLGIKEDIVEPWENGKRTKDFEKNLEYWSTQAQFDDGTNVAVIFSKKGLYGTVDVTTKEHPTATVIICNPDGTLITREASQQKNTSIKASKNICDVQIGDCVLKYKNGDYIVKYKDEVVEYTATMTPTLPVFRQDTGHMYFGDDKEKMFAWLVAVPNADVSAQLVYNNKVRTLSGKGYHDHKWSNVSLDKIIGKWNIGQFTVDDCTVVFFDIEPNKAYGDNNIQAVIIGKDGSILSCDSTKARIIDYGKKIIIYQPLEDGSLYEIEMNKNKDIYSHNFIDDMKGLKKIMANIKGESPSYHRYSGDITITITDCNGNKSLKKATGVWEQLCLASK